MVSPCQKVSSSAPNGSFPAGALALRGAGFVEAALLASAGAVMAAGCGSRRATNCGRAEVAAEFTGAGAVADGAFRALIPVIDGAGVSFAKVDGAVTFGCAMTVAFVSTGELAFALCLDDQTRPNSAIAPSKLPAPIAATNLCQ